ncbi:PREDICTED: HMG box transcription factor BBX isoform X1 [Pseudopodoces humilis]|uniref:HMG box transcription factor BBX isoform X1 n=1 Tax=Pseudopodoces humilis TaxID=181119 RepID=UPI0006B87BEF|nr:PREDICTED: HMG box transcription factor BBX isoform X1 [Pseudopodoces humilis]XP_014108837.1 PREDICTED: HMG box transcription factor BBX isoform X1 [Pseudopodoces humilis]XP_014108843.1 PREDICTED: HMG box transcription factor BBX isoform X1 [Pseudopodoces humilis]XP_014108845.1 PREDICTED: HMG box transcription factor BBX isoform X1 [Pseudopodoces humilis]XP_014108846.1 PREDICTED: HMG box transcription factor BBX isoform X1 [Pseudopodoces humilis]
MKGSSRNKDHSTEGEGTGKRPKRKCLQWHPLLAKKLLDFSEEEEEEEEEEDIDKVPLLGPDGLEQDADETEDDESSEQRARRPMNAFLLFCKRHRSLVRKEHPRLDNRGATKILADWWSVLDPKEKQKYTDMAKEYKDAFMKANPGYKWCPTTNKPVKTQASSVTNRKKLWAIASDSAKDLPSPRKVTKSEEMPQLNFGMADPTQMGGLSMLLLAGEHALTAQEVSSSTCQSDASNSTEACQKSSLFQFAEISSNTSQPGVLGAVKQMEESALFQFAEISSNTSQLPSPEPVKHCGKSALFQLAEISSSTSRSGPSDLTKQCGTSALFQLAEMCLASEGVKMKEPGKTKVEALEDEEGEVSEDMEVELEKTTVKYSSKGKVEQSEIEKMQNLDETKAVESETAKCRDFTSLAMENSPFERKDNTKDRVCRSPELFMSDMTMLGLKPEKIKKKKKKNKLDRHTNEKSTPKKSCKKRQSSESDIESVMYTIEAVAKGDWGAERLADTPRKKNRPVSNVKGSMLDTKSPKKKVKSKEKKTSKEKPMETTKESKPPDFLSIEAGKEVPCEASDNIKVEPLTPTEEVVPQSLPEQVKTEDSDCVKKIETCGSRKSERSCKGALYKTLVSEGMLTSLRANVDRGKRSSGKGNSSDHEGCWNEEIWAFSPSGTSGNKKLKKTKPKEEFVFGLAKLEEEFAKKFNSLPQYSPITFDRKNSAVSRKKRKIGSGSCELPKSNKGSFQSQKKNLFHKIVSKFKHRKKLNVPDTAILLEDRNSSESPWKNKISVSALNTPEPAMMHEPLVGSQKRKARKTKITHLVRTADGRVSPAAGTLEEKPKELPQSTLQKSSSAETDCNSECSRNTETEENHSITSDMPAVSAFFSLAALAEVAAMENVHRSQRATPLPHDGQPNEMSQAPVLISCADQ